MWSRSNPQHDELVSLPRDQGGRSRVLAVAVPQGRAELLAPGCEGLLARTSTGAACSCWLGEGRARARAAWKGKGSPLVSRDISSRSPCPVMAELRPSHPVLQWGAEWRAQAELCCRWEQRES